MIHTLNTTQLAYQKPSGACALVDGSDQRAQHDPVRGRGHGAVHRQPRSSGTDCRGNRLHRQKRLKLNQRRAVGQSREFYVQLVLALSDDATRRILALTMATALQKALYSYIAVLFKHYQ